MTRDTDSRDLGLYHRLSGLRRLGYRGKVLWTALIGLCVPLAAFAACVALRVANGGAGGPAGFTPMLGIVLVATLAGAFVTLALLNQLLRPVLLASRVLRAHGQARTREPLPTRYGDAVGTLMADTQRLFDDLDRTRAQLGFSDEATGLPNRARLLRLLETRAAQGRPFAVVVLRFDDGGRLAETLARHHAEAAGRALAARLALRTELGEHLACVGPLQFACVLGARRDDATPWVDAASRIRTALDACAGRIDLDGLAVVPVARAGLASFPDDGAQAEGLFELALAASARQDGAPVTPHGAEVRLAILARFRIEQELRHAIEHDEFELVYQPVVDVDRTRVVGAEALLRWRHPERGLLMPGDFLPAAEASGLIVPIGLWVLRRACAQLREWKDRGRHDLRMAINLSTRQFLDPHLQSHVRQALDTHGLSPDQLEIELTETSATMDAAHTRRVFGELRDMGVGIAIDDFGTGAASMGYLRRLPFDKLKIDREFVTDVHRLHGSQAICGAIIELARGLGLKVLAEGAESAAEVRWLADRGCTLFQGYYFSRPVPGRDFLDVINAPARFGGAGDGSADDRPSLIH